MLNSINKSNYTLRLLPWCPLFVYVVWLLPSSCCLFFQVKVKIFWYNCIYNIITDVRLRIFTLQYINYALIYQAKLRIQFKLTRHVKQLYYIPNSSKGKLHQFSLVLWVWWRLITLQYINCDCLFKQITNLFKTYKTA